MDYEEKYKEALERAKQFSEKPYLEDSKGIVEYIFPELKESEDERIRIWIRKELESKYVVDNIVNNVMADKALAWLEKQGEHNKFRDSIQVGDKVTRNEDGVLVNLSQLNRVAKKDEKQGNNMGISEATKRKLEDNLNKALEKETPESWNKFLDEQGEQKPAWSEEDETKLNDAIDACKAQYGNMSYTADWLKSLKERVQPKQEWSKEDIEMIDWLIRCCEKEHEELCNDRYGHQDIVSDLKRDCRKKWDWLESLKNKVVPQKQWKPSDEQMDALEYYMHTLTCNEHKEVLFGLMKQLKKLRGR